MTSQVNPNNIDGTYPVAGQDNDSQGFRDNFTNIRNNFTFVKAELEDIQNKAVFKSALTNTTLSNDLSGNIVVNPAFQGWRETYNNIGAVSGTFTPSFANGNFQKITISAPGSATLDFTGAFPSNAANQLAKIVLWVNVSTPGYSLTVPGAVSLGDKDTIAGMVGNTITFSAIELANTNDYFFEFSTVDYGTTIAIKDLTRNRAYNFSGLTVSGGNLVANSTTISSSTTTGSFVAKGGVGIAGNAWVGGNIAQAGGTINSNYAYVTLVNNQDFAANILYNTLFLDTADSATISNAYVTLPGGAENGRELTLSFLAPVTTVFINKGGAGDAAKVKWVANSIASAGNTVVRLTWSQANSNWLSS
jgi:hypothetical protein